MLRMQALMISMGIASEPAWENLDDRQTNLR
jgi:hypothetical protein